MPEIQFEGFSVDFPFQPYECQKKFIGAMLKALQQKSHALLESPTGTGKTMCLLSAALAWQTTLRAALTMDSRGGISPALKASLGVKYFKREPMKGPSAGDESGFYIPGIGKHTYADDEAGPWKSPTPPPPPPPPVQIHGEKNEVPKIIYASRTHTQLAQVAKELKRSRYRPRMCVLSSREQLCLHPRISNLRGTAQANACRAACKSRSCTFKQKLDAELYSIEHLGEVKDSLDERRKRHADKNTKGSTADASEGTRVIDIEDLVSSCKEIEICPYFLTRDPKIQHEADIILMPYNYLTDASVRAGLEIDWKNAVIIFDEAHNIEANCTDATSFELSASDIAEAIAEVEVAATAVKDGRTGEFDEEDALLMKAFFLKLEEEIDKIGTEKSSLKNAERFGAGDVQGWTLPGPALYQLLEAAQLSSKYVQQMLDMLEHISTFLREVRLGAAPESLRLEKFGKILERLFYKTGSEAIIQGPGFATSSVEWKPRFMDVSSGKSFYLVVHSGRRSGKPQRRSAFLSHDSSNRGKDLSFWCFSPGVALQQLVELEVGSIIFTSGTLSPMKSFEAEFGLKFNVKFSNSHVVADDQVCLMALNKGPSGVALNSRYQNRTSPEYMREIGMLVANAARVVPDGLLVFFPSFSVLRSTIAFWQKDQEGVLWKRITGSKVPLTEPQNTVEAREVMQMFRESVDAGRGAVLFAVCRGRVSEGLDFNNRYGRAVIVTGIPYPPQYDPKIVLKQRYLANVKTGVSGAEWYQFQAFRAVNQAIGRVLRHAKDYGAILLCDERFSTSTNMLSTWLQPYLKTLSNYGQVVYNLGRFYQHCRTTYPVVEAASALPSEETKEEQGKAVFRRASQQKPKTVSLTSLPFEVEDLMKETPSRDHTEETKVSAASTDLASVLGQQSIVNVGSGTANVQPQTLEGEERRKPALKKPLATTMTSSGVRTLSMGNERRKTFGTKKSSVLDESHESSSLGAKLFEARSKRQRIEVGKSIQQQAAASAASAAKVSSAAKAKAFMATVKSSLSAEAFNRFKMCLQSLRTACAGNREEVGKHLPRAINRLADLFDVNNDRTCANLLQELVHFVPSSCKDQATKLIQHRISTSPNLDLEAKLGSAFGVASVPKQSESGPKQDREVEETPSLVFKKKPAGTVSKAEASKAFLARLRSDLPAAAYREFTSNLKRVRTLRDRLSSDDLTDHGLLREGSPFHDSLYSISEALCDIFRSNLPVGLRDEAVETIATTTPKWFGEYLKRQWRGAK